MSRIHEALKKAELERATAQAVEVAAPAPDPSAQASQGERNSAPTVTAKLPTQASLRPVQIEGALELEEFRARCAHPVWRPDMSENVFLNPALGPHATEQFRTLRSRLIQLRSISRLRTLLVTSPLASEGKTFVANNLAQAIVRQSERCALIIDADLRRSRLHSALGAPLTPGLTDYLRGQASESEVIQHGQAGNLFLLPGGNTVSNPSELLSNGRLKTLLDRASAVFDWVIIDSPPCLPVADANVLADFCDGVLLVVRAGSTPSAIVQRAGRELHGRNVVGVVLNGVDKSLSYGSYYQAGPYLDNQAQDRKQQTRLDG